MKALITVKGQEIQTAEYTDRDVFAMLATLDMACGINFAEAYLPQLAKLPGMGGAEMEELRCPKYSSKQAAEAELIFLVREICPDDGDRWLSPSRKRLLLSMVEIFGLWTQLLDGVNQQAEPETRREQLLKQLAEIKA